MICLNIESIRQFLSWMTNTELFSPELYFLSRLPAEIDFGETTAVVIMALYINSPESLARYGDGGPLWLICPLLLYWISRVWMLSSRGRMTDDPIVFALTDKLSLGLFAAMAVCVLLALWPA